MKHFVIRFFVFFAFATLAIGCQQQGSEVQPEQQLVTTEQQSVVTEQQSVATEQQSQKLVVEAACGQCQFGLPGKSCDLAVRIDGKAYFVDGVEIDDHGDAHADDGFCNAVRQARVQGRVEKGRFVATSFELLPGDNG